MRQGYPAFPKDASWSQCDAYIENMPDRDLAEVFGVDSSAEATVQHHEGQQLLQTIISLQPRIRDKRMLTRSGRARKQTLAINSIH